MNSEYTAASILRQESWFSRLRREDYRSVASVRAQERLYAGLLADAVCLSGGGPTRAHPRLINLNIGPFPNVDIVADAHRLPYANASVDAIHCEAVFEHLHSPVVAAGEVYRVMKQGARAFVCTPFLQGYHGYPHHYQNFTLSGHVNLFERAGLAVTESGTCVGPVYTLRNLTAVFLGHYLPSPLNKLAGTAWSAISLVLGPLDRVIAKNRNSHVLASTTYLLAQKLGKLARAGAVKCAACVLCLFVQGQF